MVTIFDEGSHKGGAMKRNLIILFVVTLLSASILTVPVSAGSDCGSTYTVKRGDNLFKIAQQCETTIAALLGANPKITNPRLIYPGQVLKIPSSNEPSPGIGGSVYLVKPGDTLNIIASLFKVSLQDLLKANPSITNPNRIDPGLQIRLPENAASVRTTGISPIRGKAGDLVTLAVTGFQPNTDLEVRFGLNEKETEIIGNLKTDGRGAILQKITVPASAQSGKSYIFLVRVRSKPEENAVSNSFQIGQPSDSTAKVYIVERRDTLRKIADKFNTTVAAILVANPSIKNPNLIQVGQRIILPSGSKTPAVMTISGEAAAGSKIRVVADGFPANQAVDIRIGPDLNNPALIVDAKTDVSGYLNQEITVPASAKPGDKWHIRIHTTDLAKTIEAVNSFKIK